jgi:sulfoxide reductase heme-binding subunit YedZ
MAHVVIGIQVHMGIWLYFFRKLKKQKKWCYVLIFLVLQIIQGCSQHILLLLLALSNDLSLRRLKRAEWKSLQRWNYGLFALVFIHG